MFQKATVPNLTKMQVLKARTLRNLTKTTEAYEILRKSIFVGFRNVLQDCEKLIDLISFGPQQTQSLTSN